MIDTDQRWVVCGENDTSALPNTLAVDFAMTGDVVAVAAELNGLGQPVAAGGN